MKKEIADKWVEALRSGKYQQGQLALRPEETQFCCLGVLCDIIAPNDWMMPPMTNKAYTNKQYVFLKGNGEHEGQVLPPTVKLAAGMNSDNGMYHPAEGSAVALSEMNDSGSSFAELANFIELNWKQL